MVNCKVLLYFLFLIRSSTSQLSTNCHDRINDNALSGNLGYKVIAGQRYFTPGDIVRGKSNILKIKQYFFKVFMVIFSLQKKFS